LIKDPGNGQPAAGRAGTISISPSVSAEFLISARRAISPSAADHSYSQQSGHPFSMLAGLAGSAASGTSVREGQEHELSASV
jgi:hypothetical protein